MGRTSDEHSETEETRIRSQKICRFVQKNQVDGDNLLMDNDSDGKFPLFTADSIMLLTPLFVGAIVTTSWIVTEKGVRKLWSTFSKK